MERTAIYRDNVGGKMFSCEEGYAFSSPLLRKRSLLNTRPSSYLAAINNSVLTTDSPKLSPSSVSPCFTLPREIWLLILVNYGLSGKDLANLELSCKWFTECWEECSLIEEAARLIIKRYKRARFGELTNRLRAMSCKERLHILNKMEKGSCVLAAGSYQNIALADNNSRVISWGAGIFGQLGNGVSGDQPALQNVQVPSNVVQVSAGCGHSGVVTETGEVFVCGDNRYGQLGLPNTGHGQHFLTPFKVGFSSSIHVLQIACGSSHTMFLSDMGKVYSVGQGDSGQLGLGPHIKATVVPTCLPLQYDEFNFTLIVTGIAHNVLITECGKAFTCGLGSVGQLGHGGTKNLSTPAQVTAFVRDRIIVNAAASVCHTILLDSKGDVFTCGKGEGTLGHGDTAIRTIPKRLEGLEGIPISSAAAGVCRSVFISRDGRGYWCGVGMGNNKNVVQTVPIEMAGLPEPLAAAAIGNSHIVLRTRSGRFMSMGNNGRHQTGHVTPNNSPILEYTYINNQ